MGLAATEFPEGMHIGRDAFPVLILFDFRACNRRIVGKLAAAREQWANEAHLDFADGIPYRHGFGFD